jgi:hypothetical protein
VTITGKIAIGGNTSKDERPPDDDIGISSYRVKIAEAVNERMLAARRISELTKRATAALDRLPQPAAGASWNDEDGLITPRQVAGLLKIDIGTVRLWDRIGVLEQALSPQGDRRFRRADVLTFLTSSRKVTGQRDRFPADIPECAAGPA